MRETQLALVPNRYAVVNTETGEIIELDQAVARLRWRDNKGQHLKGGPTMPAFSPHDLRHRYISLRHLAGDPWARIGEDVGQRDLAVTANTYSHVLVDEAEVDYAGLLEGGA